jgi:hypothetical protein
MKKWMLLFALGLLQVFAQRGLQATAVERESAYRVGLVRKCITPDEPLWMAGYMGRHQPSQGVLDDLYAQALAIEDAGGHRAVLLTVDVCVLRTATVNQVCEQIAERSGLHREQILVNVSHTHSGPAVDQLDDGYPMSPEDRQKLAAYTERLKGHLVDLAEAAVGDLEPAALSFGVGTATFFENRRRLDAEGRCVGMGPNPQNHTDRDVPVLRVADPRGNIRALVFGAACHNVTLGGNSYKISGDFSRAAQRHIETHLPGVQTVFMTGCGADANPHPRANAEQEEWVTRHGESLGAEVLAVMSRPMQPVSGPLRTTFEFVDLSLREVPCRPELEKMRRGGISQSHVAGRMLAALDRGDTLPTKFSAPISVWQFGDCLTLVGLPEETVSEYVSLLKRAIGPKGLWTAGYSHDVCGYLPTVKILHEGGYETRGLFAADKIGWFAPAAEGEVVEAVCRMAREVGRKLPPPTPEKIEPIAWWRFEPHEFLSDASGHGLKLITNHGPAAGGEPAPVFSSEASVALDGTNYLEGSKLRLPGAGKTGLTMAAWVKPDKAALSGVRMIVCQWANTVEDDHFSLSLNDGKPGMGVADGVKAEQGVAGKTVLEVDRWYFIAGTWDAVSRQYRLFLDGRPEPTVGYQTGNGINGSSETTLKIGAEAVPGHERRFCGRIDEVMLFDAALDEERIRRLCRGEQ